MQAQAVAVAGLPEREFGVAVLGVSGQRPGVDGVGFAERSERADEGFDLAGVGAVSRDACGEQGGQEIALIAAGRLADHEAGRVERGGEVEQSSWLVGDRTRPGIGGVEDDDFGFADVAPDEARNRRGGMGDFSLSFASL